MLLELRHVRYLMAVAEHGGFTRAAEVLHISQPTLSQQIRKLELTLGAALLDRSGRQVRLTDIGAAFLDRARVGLREVAAAERAIADVRDLSRGDLRVGATPTFGDGALASPLSDFATLAPGIRVSIERASQTALEERLLNDDLDLALGFAGRHAAGIVARALYEEDLHLIVSADRDVPADATDPQWLSGQRFALLPSTFATRIHVDGYFDRLGISVEVTFEADSVGALVEVVKRTSLTTVLPGHAIAADTGIRSAGRIDSRQVVLLEREGAYTSAAATSFRRLLTSWRPRPHPPLTRPH